MPGKPNDALSQRSHREVVSRPRRAWTRRRGLGLGATSVAYLVSQYPAPSHTFIHREVVAMRQAGVDVRTFSVRGCPPELILDETMRLEADSTTVLLRSRAQLARNVILMSVLHPFALGRAVRRSKSLGPRGLRARAWQLFYLAEAITLLAHLRRTDIRHVHTHFANNGADVARALTALALDLNPDGGWSWSFTMHGPAEFFDVTGFDLAGKVRSAAAVACITEYARSQLMRLVEPSHWDKLCVVPASVDTDDYAPATRRKREPEDALRILFVGRLVAAKAPNLLLQAVSRATENGICLEVRVAGDGPLRNSLEEQVERERLGASVRFLGAVPQAKVRELCAWADAFVLPSFMEGLPVVVMEALATECPVITTDVAGIPELVKNEVTGLLVTPGRPDAVSDALRRLARQPDLGPRLGRAGRDQVVDRHSTRAMTAAQLAFFSDLGIRPARAEQFSAAHSRVSATAKTEPQ